MIRSMLFIPGNSPGMLLNADIHRADAIILDLEDAVAPDQKDAARILVRNALTSLAYKDVQIIVRVNPVDTAYCAEDLREVVPLRPQMIMPTKVDGAACIKAVSGMIAQIERQHHMPDGGVKLIPLIETAAGIENAYEIAKADPRVTALFLGAEDYSADLRAKRTKASAEIVYARGRILNAARAAAVDAYDTPFTDVNDEEGMYRDAALARELGFTGKAVISPRHVRAVNDVFSPSAAEIEYAYAVLAAIEEGKRLGKGAVSLKGKMIDKPIVDRAKYTLEMAKALGLEADRA